MPVYEFVCRACNKSFELRQNVEEHLMRKPPCPWCGSAEVESTLSSFFARTTRKA